MRSDIVPGATFPDYELPDHDNVPRRLSELQGDDPLILTLARGHYCPKEHQQHLELAANYPKIAVAYTKIATIATDEHHALQEFRASVGAQWPFLADPGRIVQQDLDIQEYTDPDNDPMIPHTLVLGPGLVVHSIYNGYWFWGRPSFVDLWHDLRAVTREVRPDWDLSTPGLRGAWEAGDVSPFHGWDRRAAPSGARDSRVTAGNTNRPTEVNMSSIDVGTTSSTEMEELSTIDMALEVVTVPVSDVDRAKRFYQSLGWRLDIDLVVSDDFRQVQMTPPHSQCSIHFGKGITAMEPGSLDRLYLAVKDIDAARKDLASRGVDVTEVEEQPKPPGFDLPGRSYFAYASFKDPDGNGWLLQEVTTRLPGREWED